MARLRFLPADGGQAFALPLSPALSLLVTLMREGAPLRHDCGGKARCGTCRVAVDDGRALSPMLGAERERLSSLGLPLDGSVRLACQARAFRDLEARGLVELESGSREGET